MDDTPGTSGRPKPAFYAVVLLVVAVLLYVGFSRFTGRPVLGSRDSTNVSAEELAKMPTYYIMDLADDMPAAEYVRQVGELPPLRTLAQKLGATDPATLASAGSCWRATSSATAPRLECSPPRGTKPFCGRTTP